MPALIPEDTLRTEEEKRREKDIDNTAEETDADIAKRDLIQVKLF